MQKPFSSNSLFILFLLSVLPMSAQQVSIEVAMQKAVSFLSQPDSPSSMKMKVPRKNPQLKLVNNRDEFYIFNDESNGGFVIVSGDERMPAILGYSFEGSFVADQLPDNFREWLEGYAAQVDYLRKNPQTEVASQRKVQGSSISPMLDCEWDQWWPYNTMCPNGSPAGCAATAMAQIMYYHKWPEQTRNIIHGYFINALGCVAPDYPIMTIDWDNMLPNYQGEPTQEQIDAVAQLIVLCGESVKMQYDASGSGARADNVLKSLPRYFGYDINISMVYNSDYEQNTWNQLIYDELSNHRPVLYGGSNESMGHVFVVDGYDGNDYFHLNWGWGGYMNGNYLLSVLPDYNNDQCAIIGIKPSSTALPETYGVLENGTMTLYYDTEKKNRSGKVFPDLMATDPNFTSEIELLHCPQDSEMVVCIIDSSFADYELESLYCFFSQCENLKTITGLKNLNTTHVTEITGMFYGCSSLETIDFNGFCTDHVHDMGWMFQDCISLKALNLSGFNTNHVIMMDGMFENCSSLKELDINSFNTENTALMQYMFDGCSSLEKLDLSNFNTKNNLTMYSMFEGCSSLTELDLSSFNTENVVDMTYTFRYCSSLKNIDLCHFNTENVIQMSAMFEGCSSLESLDLSSFNTEKVNSMFDMFFDCHSLKTLDLSSFNTSNVIEMERMFHECNSLESLDLSNFNTENVASMFYLFRYCTSLKSLNVSSFDTSNVTNMWGMFEGVCSLTSLDISNFNTEKVTDMREMFAWCSSLKSINLSSFNTSNVTNMSMFFFMCEKLKTVFVSDDWNTDNVEDNGGAMFYGCDNLIGEMGTKWNNDHQNLEYAHIDGGPDNPGYLSSAFLLPLGDVNNDQIVDISDVLLIVDYILGRNPEGFIRAKSDINKDGQIDISDVLSTVDIILGRY